MVVLGNLDVEVRGLPNEDLVHGFPGIPATKPRVMGSVIVRQNPRNMVKSKKSLGVTKVKVMLMRTDTITFSGTKSTTFTLNQQEIWSSAHGKDVYGLDLPFMMAIGKSGRVTGSMSLLQPQKIGETTHSIYVYVTCGQDVTGPWKFPVRIRRFDTMSTFSALVQPISKKLATPDHLVIFEYSLPSSGFGHGDQILAYFHLRPNPDIPKAKKVKVVRISLELVQKVTFSKSCVGPNEHVPEPRQNRICKEATDFDDLRLDQGYVEPLKLRVPEFPTEDDYERYKVRPPEQQDIPSDGRLGFTNTCGMFDVRYHLIFKVRLKHARDVLWEQDITICEFDHLTCTEYHKSIVATAELARYADLAPPVERHVLTKPPTMEIRIT